MTNRLTQEQRRKIVRLAAEEGLSQALLAERFGVSKKHVQEILANAKKGKGGKR